MMPAHHSLACTTMHTDGMALVIPSVLPPPSHPFLVSCDSLAPFSSALPLPEPGLFHGSPMIYETINCEQIDGYQHPNNSRMRIFQPPFDVVAQRLLLVRRLEKVSSAILALLRNPTQVSFIEKVSRCSRNQFAYCLLTPRLSA